MAIVVMAATGVLLAMALLKLQGHGSGHISIDNGSGDADPLIEQINALLPQTQCRRCTFDGCKPYATALARNEADINQCPPGGHETAVALAKLLGRTPKPVDARFGVVRTAPLVAWIDEPACIGCAKCILACPVDAIVGASKYMHTVITAQCTGCELCVAPCPVDCIEMRAAEADNFMRDPAQLRTS